MKTKIIMLFILFFSFGFISSRIVYSDNKNVDSKKSIKLAKMKTTTWKTIKVPVLEEFEINSVKFAWQPIDMEKRLAMEKAIKEKKPFQPENDIKLKIIQHLDKTKDIGFISVKADIQDPSLFNFQTTKIGVPGLTIGFWNEGDNSRTLLLKIDSEYIAIKPLDSKGDVITYKWKSWSDTTPTKEITNKTTTKQQ